ncbi:BQ2448_4286 [Microbotryum intermedium]|uniref:BQ2448_4286 protein n=1 Tax=Microbotryum intermedium TaxID=269621 RepID=A0A238FIX8_9BASI|nr:BQ2448_4286 [Microbotryum intermedium]
MFDAVRRRPTPSDAVRRQTIGNALTRALTVDRFSNDSRNLCLCNLPFAVLVKGQYGLILGTILGSTIWHSFLAGPVSSPWLKIHPRSSIIILTLENILFPHLQLAYSHLPRQQFGNLQSKLFPPFFALQSAGSLVLLGLYKRAGHVLSRHDSTSWVLGGMSVAGLLNLLIVGPWTTAIMFRRHRVERLEGTTYSAPDPSPKMKSLNKRFAIAHSISSLLNLGFVFAVVGHAAWIAQNGLTML